MNDEWRRKIGCPILLVTEYSFQSVSGQGNQLASEWGNQLASEWGNQLASGRGNQSESECSSFVTDVTDDRYERRYSNIYYNFY